MDYRLYYSRYRRDATISKIDIRLVCCPAVLLLSLLIKKPGKSKPSPNRTVSDISEDDQHHLYWNGAPGKRRRAFGLLRRGFGLARRRRQHRLVAHGRIDLTQLLLQTTSRSLAPVPAQWIDHSIVYQAVSIPMLLPAHQSFRWAIA